MKRVVRPAAVSRGVGERADDPAAVGPVESIDEHTCQLSTGADSVETLALWAGLLDADFDVIDSPDLVARLEFLARRYARAARSGPVR